MSTPVRQSLTRILYALYGNNDPMILPGNLFFSSLLLILSLLCWGSWANTLKLSGPRWRFELYCYDFAIGALLLAVILSFTFGGLGLDGFTVKDDLQLAGKRQESFAFLAGCIFTLGNFLLIGAISLVGMSAALPMGLGVAMIVASGLAYALNPVGSPLLTIFGALAVLASVVLAALACKGYAQMKAAEAKAAQAAAAEEIAAQTKPGAGKKKPGRRRPVFGKAILMSVAGGLLIGVFMPLLDSAREGENGLGPYSAALLFAVGVVFSSFVYNLFFMNLPVQGAPVEFSQYFTGKAKDHLQGIAGGALWFAGLVLTLVATRAEGAAHPGPALVYAAAQGAIPLGALWGLTAWKEFNGADSATRIRLGAMILLLLAGVGAASLAPR